MVPYVFNNCRKITLIVSILFSFDYNVVRLVIVSSDTTYLYPGYSLSILTCRANPVTVNILLHSRKFNAKWVVVGLFFLIMFTLMSFFFSNSLYIIEIYTQKAY